MKKRILSAAFMLGAVLVSNSSYAMWTVMGRALVERIDKTNLNLTCLSKEGVICYTDDHVNMDIYMADGSHLLCHSPEQGRTLIPVPGTAGQFIQVGSIVVEPIDINQQW